MKISHFFTVLGLLLNTSASIAAGEPDERGVSPASTHAAAVAAVLRPMPEDGIAIPEIARGHEEVYRRFVRGVLIYRPREGSDEGRIDLPIAAFANPLSGTFDLSRCGGQSLSISTGYRKGKKAKSADKIEIWVSPRFLIERELGTTGRYFREIMGNWATTAPVGIFWNWGGWDDLGWYDYLTDKAPEEINSKDLFQNWGTRINGLPEKRDGRIHGFWHEFFCGMETGAAFHIYL